MVCLYFTFEKPSCTNAMLYYSFDLSEGEIELSLLLHCVKYPSNTTQIVLCNYPITSEGWWRIDIPVHQAYLLLAYMCILIFGIILICTAVLIALSLIGRKSIEYSVLFVPYTMLLPFLFQTSIYSYIAVFHTEYISFNQAL